MLLSKVLENVAKSTKRAKATDNIVFRDLKYKFSCLIDFLQKDFETIFKTFWVELCDSRTAAKHAILHSKVVKVILIDFFSFAHVNTES